MSSFDFMICDFETFSAVDISKCGSFRYMDDPSFEPLLLSFAHNDEPVSLVDFARGETWPEDFLAALRDPDVVKLAWNCAFEREVIRTALGQQGVDVPCEVDVYVTGDAGIQELNREMRQVDRPTDVLSFPEFELTPGELPGQEDADPGTGYVPLGDMAISLERVKAQAKEYGHSNRRELAYLAVHSVLHLLGYDHMDEGEQKARMRAREEAIMAVLGLERK